MIQIDSTISPWPSQYQDAHNNIQPRAFRFLSSVAHFGHQDALAVFAKHLNCLYFCYLLWARKLRFASFTSFLLGGVASLGALRIERCLELFLKTSTTPIVVSKKAPMTASSFEESVSEREYTEFIQYHLEFPQGHRSQRVLQGWGSTINDVMHWPCLLAGTGSSRSKKQNKPSA